jgi:hypothetical protein
MTYKILKLYINTLSKLRFRQVYYRVYYFFRNKINENRYHKTLNKTIYPLVWKNHIFYNNCYLGENHFTFLNLSHLFKERINWNFLKKGKLWAYNLNYFDFLNQKKITKKDGILLIDNFVKHDKNLSEGMEAYPISLRGINWIKFLSFHQIENQNINQKLYDDYQYLIKNLEYHISANHLLENAFSLLFAAYYFKEDAIYTKAKELLIEELNEQILTDGGHYERSPMYHQIIFHRLLDCVQLVKNNKWKNDNLQSILLSKSQLMYSWLSKVTFDNGNIPMIKDSAHGIAASSKELFDYAVSLGVNKLNRQLLDSGYRKYITAFYEFFIDVGSITPAYQSGHAHADAFSFELYVKNKPLIVDTGISTYEKNELRQKERGTAAHNTVMIANENQSQIWSGFRVANRAKVVLVDESEDSIEAYHNGYKQFGVIHNRKVFFKKNQIKIKDSISKKIDKEQVAFIHFHPSIVNIVVENKTVKLIDQGINIVLKGADNIKIETYQFANGFNERLEAFKINTYFSEFLETHIDLSKSII